MVDEEAPNGARIVCGPGKLADLLEASAALHHHLCPRQVLGVRLGLCGGALLELAVPQRDKRLLVIAETDGCAADGIAVATGCWVGRRTLRIEDLGKVAATFVDCVTGRAVRVVPRGDVRGRAKEFAPDAHGRWQEQLFGYQRMPEDQLLTWSTVRLVTPVDVIVSQPGRRAVCTVCHEEVMNDRQVVMDGAVLCRTCAGQHYYWLAGSE